jgi:hypothetical protein
LDGTFETVEEPLEDDPTNVIYAWPKDTVIFYPYTPAHGEVFRVIMDGVSYDVPYV